MYFKKYTIWREYKPLFLGTFNIIINYIFPENVIEIRSVSQKIYLLQKN